MTQRVLTKRMAKMGTRDVQKARRLVLLLRRDVPAQAKYRRSVSGPAIIITMSCPSRLARYFVY